MSEEELKQIEYELQNLEELEPWDNGISYSDFDYNFLSKSRERIAALVKEVKTLRGLFLKHAEHILKVNEELEHYKMLNDLADRKIIELEAKVFDLENPGYQWIPS